MVSRITLRMDETATKEVKRMQGEIKASTGIDIPLNTLINYAIKSTYKGKTQKEIVKKMFEG